MGGSKMFKKFLFCFLMVITYASLLTAGQAELRDSLEQDLQYYERVVKSAGKDARINFLNRLIQKYENKRIDSAYLIPVKSELKKLQPIRKDTKQKTTLKRYKKSPAKSRGNIKIGMDISGKHKISGEGASGSEDVEEGTSLSIEYGSIIDKGVELGIGMTYQLPRAQEDYDGDFNFVPIYGLIKIYSATSDPSPYLIGQLGYDIFYKGDSDYKGELSLSGGIYYGIGAGLIFNRSFQIEGLYSINKGEGDYPGGYYGGYYVPSMSFDIEYSKINLSIGFRI